MWHLRMLPGVRQSFAAAFGVAESELLVSFDGASLVLAGRESALSPSGPHVDQVAHLQGLEREGTNNDYKQELEIVNFIYHEAEKYYRATIRVMENDKHKLVLKVTQSEQPVLHKK